MQVEEYKQDPNKNSDLKPKVEEMEKHPEETTIEFVDLKKAPEVNLTSYTAKLIKDFFIAYGFKIIFKMARKLDKSVKTSLSFDQLFSIVFDLSNVKYGLFVVTMKILFTLFRKLLYMIKLQNVVEYKRLNFIFGLLTNVIMYQLGKKSRIIFYTCIYYIIKSFLFFMRIHVYGTKERVYAESKEFYYIGASLGYILLNIDYMKSIKKYFM